ncbi:1-acyl-sn-glycerol-3-phosphate acyltransferase [Candidatus Uhrbacteria bacterium]|nr:1-acyl-sn-glycerol-3-phosphate acyltransferase [Candidatus Uhrbacteria bacterium]
MLASAILRCRPYGQFRPEAKVHILEKLARFIVGLAIFIGVTCGLAFPHLLFIMARRRLFGGDEGRYRNAVMSCFTFWASRGFDLIQAVLAMKVTVRWAPNMERAARQQLIIIANHESSLEVLPIIRMLHDGLGVTDVRFVMKNQLRWAPVVGLGCLEGGCAFVDRNGDRKDVLAVSDSAAMAKREGASYFIYPEGTRSPKGAPNGRYRRLGDPKLGGFVRLCKEHGGWVLSVASIWPGPPIGAKTMFQAYKFVGRELIIDVGLSPPVPHEQAGEWLRSVEWPRMDDVVSGDKPLQAAHP